MKKRQTSDELRKQVFELYNSGLSAIEIMQATGIKSTSTLYKIINDLGIRSKRNNDGSLYRIAITLTEDVRSWCESQQNLSQAIEQLIREKIAYSQIEGTSENAGNEPQQPIAGSSEQLDASSENVDSGAKEMPYSQTEDDEVKEIVMDYYDDYNYVKTEKVFSFPTRDVVEMLARSLAEDGQKYSYVNAYLEDKLLWTIHLE